ncbi:MAG: dihydrofolate reductase [Ignavibacteriae bacterium]|nr:dihydrofolate reductase [Ignavibacteriota bacterium]MCB9215329.1 dihydrofolate reductase [Ignavibacteria bacterium]
MRKLLLNLAVSLDGLIEGPNGEYDWCFTDQDYGMAEFFNRIDALFIGRKSYEMMLGMGGDSVEIPGMPKLTEYVFSNSLEEVNANAILVSGDIVSQVEKIKGEEGKDIWLFGGADLTEALMNAGLVDELSLAVHPIVLGAGKPLFAGVNRRVHLDLINSKPWSSGLVTLNYRVRGEFKRQN